jgi:branched-chain amino acid transport system permease protein
VSDELGFFFLLVSNGVLIGLMYALIALGFVLVYKATDAVNFAQGEFVLLAGLLAAPPSTSGAPPSGSRC